MSDRKSYTDRLINEGALSVPQFTQIDYVEDLGFDLFARARAGDRCAGRGLLISQSTQQNSRRQNRFRTGDDGGDERV